MDVQVPQDVAVGAIDWQFLEHLKALEQAVNPEMLKGSIVEKLQIDDQNINWELEHQPANSFQFHCIAIRARKILSIFDNTLMKGYESHVHTFAKHYMRALNEKDTLDARMEYAVTLFGRSVTPVERMTYAGGALRGARLLATTPAKLDKEQAEDKAAWDAAVLAFHSQMYPPNLPIYEDMIRQREDMAEKVAFAEALADEFKQRNFLVKAVSDRVQGGASGEGMRVMAGNRISPNLVAIFKRTLANNPNAADELLADILTAHTRG